MLATLRHRNLSLLIVAQTISFTGNWVLFVGLPFYVYDLTGSALAAGTLFMAEVIPQLALGSFAGVFVDRWDRRRTRIASDLLRLLIIVPLLTVPATEWVWVVYAVAVSQAAVVQFSAPATLALIPRLVPGERLVQANSLYALTQNLAMLVGPALGGALLAFGGLVTVVLVDGGTFLVSAALVALIPAAAGVPRRATDGAAGEERAEEAPEAAPGVLRQWREGLSQVRGSRRLVAVFSGAALMSVGDGLLIAGIVVFVDQAFGGGSLEFGWLLTARGLGGVIGGVAIAQLGGRISETRLMVAGALGAGVLMAAIANIHVLAVAMVLLLLAGLPAMAWGVSVQTLLQRSVDDVYRGRVFGALTTTMSIAALFGMAVSATTIDTVGAVLVFNVSAACSLVAGVVVLVMARGGRETAPEAVEATDVGEGADRLAAREEETAL